MGPRRHLLSNVDPDERTADCKWCGVGIKVMRCGVDRRGRQKYVCVRAHRQWKAGAQRAFMNATEADHLLLMQESKCAICHRVMDVPHLDHCHTTGTIRGYLCRGCNFGLGFFRDNPESLQAAIAYLANPPTSQPGFGLRAGGPLRREADYTPTLFD